MLQAEGNGKKEGGRKRRRGEKGVGKYKSGGVGQQQDLPVRAEATGGGGVPMNSRAA